MCCARAVRPAAVRWPIVVGATAVTSGRAVTVNGIMASPPTVLAVRARAPVAAVAAAWTDRVAPVPLVAVTLTATSGPAL